MYYIYIKSKRLWSWEGVGEIQEELGEGGDSHTIVIYEILNK